MIENRSSAHIFHQQNGFLVPIERSYWEEGFASVSLHGRMFDLCKGQTYAEEWDNAPVLVQDAEAIVWLKKNGIVDTDQAFPNKLRAKVDGGPTLRGSQYQKQAFLDEAVERLHENGDLVGRGAQAKFEEEMRIWYEDKFEVPPKKRTVRNYVIDARRRFLTEKAINYGI